VEDDSTLEIQCNFSILEEGSYKLRFLLFHEGEEYRDLHIWIKVFETGYLKRSNDEMLEFFIAGPGGDPNLLPSLISGGAPLPMSFGARNIGAGDIRSNLTLKIGNALVWSGMNSTVRTAVIDQEKGAFFILDMNSTSSAGPIDILIFLPVGTWTLEVDLIYNGGALNIDHIIEVEGG
jgi:hypothetical protein